MRVGDPVQTESILRALPQGIGRMSSGDNELSQAEPLAPFLALSRDKRLLGLDLGTKTIGLALSDVKLTVATSLETIQRKKFTVDATHLLEIAAKYDVGGLIFGWPLNMDGSEGPRTQATAAFMRNLAKMTDLPMGKWDERLSTAAVTRMLIDADASRARRGEVVDKLAASYILQGALDRIKFIRNNPGQTTD